MFLEAANEVATTIADNPFAAGGAAYVLVEAIKKLKPDLVENKEAKAAIVLPIVAAAALKIAGVVGFATMAWPALLLNAFIGGILAKVPHDAIACAKEQKVEAVKAEAKEAKESK